MSQKMKLKELLTGISVCLCVHLAYSDILELGEDEQGIPVWKNGEYRDRNEIPLPPNYDDEKKHKRDTAEDLSVNKGKQGTQASKKNLINRVHFAMPFGVDLPLYHVSKGSGKKGKKSSVPASKQSRSDRLKLDDMLEYGKLDVQTPDRKSSVSRTWGMTYENVFQDKPKETTGESRSNLATEYKIKEEDLEDGMMFRGLGGLKLRDQNHQIIDGKFADEEADEMDVRSDVSKTPSWHHDLYHFKHLFNNHYHRPHVYRYKPYGPGGDHQNNDNRAGQQQQSQQQQQQQQQPNQLQQQPLEQQNSNQSQEQQQNQQQHKQQ